MKTPLILTGIASRHEHFIKPNVNLSINVDLTAGTPAEVAANKAQLDSPHVNLTGLTREAFDRFTSGETVTITIK